jgi:hypothetical protein
MEWRFADGKYERFPELAAELVDQTDAAGYDRFGSMLLKNTVESAESQELADEAFRDLLAKRGRPLGLKDQLKRSLRSDVKAEGDSGASGTRSSGRKKTPARTAKRGRKNDAPRPRNAAERG